MTAEAPHRSGVASFVIDISRNEQSDWSKVTSHGTTEVSCVMELVETPVDSISEVVHHMKEGFVSGRTRPLGYRVQQLKNLRRLINENQDKLCQALWHDLHKPQQEVMMTELNLVLSDVSLAVSNVEKWMSPQHVAKDLVNRFNTAYIKPEPYGVVLIISPWNYPLLLSLQPLVGVIAAGNSCVLKCSELAIATSNILVELIPKYLDQDCFSVVSGGIEIAEMVTSQRFDYIFFTGGGSIGKKVMIKAAENLTPVTLELGGKSPVIVADDANIEVACQRIMWGKCINAGQSCVAPDYILCSLSVKDELVEGLCAAVERFFGQDPKMSTDFSRIINRRHFQRILALLDPVRDKIVVGGDSDASELYIAPTVVNNVSCDDSVMTNEIFGPVLPIVPIENMQKAIEFVNQREKPLVIYVFTESHQNFLEVLQGTSAGATVQNDTMMQNSLNTLPFGGVGGSGFGAYHGKFSFDTFSHHKSVLSTSTAGYLEGVNNIRYPPYSKNKSSDIQSIQSPDVGRFSRLVHLAQLVTKSASGYAPYRSELPNVQRDTQERDPEDET